MRRWLFNVRRWVFNLAVAVSLVMCVAIGVLWVRSLWHLDVAAAQHIRWAQPDEADWLSLESKSGSGRLAFEFNRTEYDAVYFRHEPHPRSKPLKPLVDGALGFHLDLERYDTPFARSILSLDSGFDASHERYTVEPGHYVETCSISAPDWLPIVLLLLLPTFWLHRFWKGSHKPRLGIAASLSVLLAIVCGGLWILSPRGLHLTGMGYRTGGLTLESLEIASSTQLGVFDDATLANLLTQHWQRLGIEYGSFNNRWSLWIAWWLPTAFFVSLSLLLWLRRRHVARRIRAGLCTHCGYDLRATPDRCPECGAAAGAAAQADRPRVRMRP